MKKENKVTDNGMEREDDDTTTQGDDGKDATTVKDEVPVVNGASESGGKRKRKRKRKNKTSEISHEVERDNDRSNDGDHVDHASGKDMVSRTVYVEGIPFDATSDQVKEFFQTKGEIDDVTELRLPTWQDSGRLRGYGHIMFDSSESYEKALTLSGEHLGKRYLTIQAANTPRNNHRSSSTQPMDGSPPSSECRTLFVNNLPYDASDEEISEVFEKSSGVSIPDDGIRIARNSVTRQSKGFCYIDFEKPKDAQKVMKSDRRLVVKGRLLRLDWDTGRIKGSYRAESGKLWTKEVKDKKKARTGH